MRRLFMAAAVLVAAGLIGCNQSPPGGKTSKDTPSGSTFKIKAPLTATTVKQGDKQTIKLTLDRGKDFKEDVTLTVDAPEGLTVELDPKKVKASDSETVTMSVSAAKTAAVGDNPIKVTGKPETGDSTSVDVKVKVEKPAE